MTALTIETGDDLGVHSSRTGIEGGAGEIVPPAPSAVAALTRGMVAGDENAYRVFHEAYFHRLSRYLLVVARGDEEAARDALQAAFVRVARHIKVFDDETRFWNWLTVLARTAFADQRRKRSRYLSFLDRFTEHARAEAVCGGDGEADGRLLAGLDHGIRSLPPDERELVERKYFGNETVRDIAATLQTSEKAVESRLVRVRRKLKDMLLSNLNDEQAD